ncbi:MAG: biotin/lipoyl-binding protein [Phycisphaerales bacterium]
MKMRITVEGKAYEVEVEMLEEGTGARVTSTRRAQQQATAPATQAAPTQQARSDGPSPTTADGGKSVKSPIAGMVQSIAVKAGDEVQVNDTLLVLEAMKMESSVASPIAGTVKTVHAEAGQAVRMGDVLVEFE